MEQTSKTHALRGLRLTLPGVWVCGAAALALVVSQFLPWSDARTWAVALTSGLPVALLLRSRYRFTEFFAVAGAGSLIVLSVAGSAALALGLFPLGGIVGIAAICFAAMPFLRARALRLSVTRTDLGAFAAVVAVAPFVMAVYVANGPTLRPEGEAFRMRSWVTRDSAYLFSITQQMIERRAVADEHPFAAGVPLYYARLGHCGLALLSAVRGQPAALALWDLFALLHIASVVMLWHAVDRRVKCCARRRLWITLAVVPLALLVRPDFYVYPQTQSLTLPVLFLALWWLAQPQWWESPRARTLGWGLALWLAAAHTVSGTVGVTAFAAGAVPAMRGAGWRVGFYRGLRWGAALAMLVAVLVTAGAPPYGPQLTWPHIESWKMLWRESAPYLVVYAAVAASVLAMFRRGACTEAATVLGLFVVAVAYSFQGLFCAEAFSAFFAMFNAQRFLYFALLVALPLIVYASPRLGMVWFVALGVGLVLYPPRVVADCLQLIVGRPLVYVRDDLALYGMIRHQTPPTARFVTNAQHWGLPTFTGRCEFARGPVMLFGLHSVPESEAKRLFALREKFLAGDEPLDTWSELRRYGIEYVLIENADTEEGKALWRRLKNGVSAEGFFTDDLLTSRAVVMRWISRYDH